MSEPTVSELLVRIEQLEGARRSRPHPRRRRLAIVAAMAVALLAVPVGVFASHQFTDVSNSHQFHAAISKLKGAGITAGCSATKYCPGNAVNRGSMAAFLTRAVGRGSFASWNGTSVPDATTTYTTLTIKAGDVTGGTAKILLEASATAYTASLAGCPCGAVFFIDDGSTQVGYPMYFNPTEVIYGANAIDSAAVSTYVTVPTGVTQTFRVRGFRTIGTSTIASFGALTATYVPYEGNGSNPTLSGTVEVQGDPGGPSNPGG